MRNIISSEKGLTLIELLIALLIAGMVTSLVFSLFFSGMRTFDDGTTRANLQQNARLVGEHLKGELRNAVSLEVKEGNNEGEDYFKIENRSLVKSGASVTDEVVEQVELEIVNEDTKKPLLKYEIKCNKGDQEHLYENRILLNNDPEIEGFKENNGKGITLSGEKGYLLYYEQHE